MKPRVFWTIYDEKPGGELEEHDTLDMTEPVCAVLRNIGLDPAGFLGLPRAERAKLLGEIGEGKVRKGTVDAVRLAALASPRPTIHARTRSQFVISRYDEDETGELVYVSANHWTHAQLLRLLGYDLDEFNRLTSAAQEQFLERLSEGGMTPAAAKEAIQSLAGAAN